MQTAGIYLHFPFCRHKCDYCDFYSVAGQDDRILRFVSALEREINTWKGAGTDWQFDTIFFGGGTPSLLDPNQLEQILAVLRQKFTIATSAEISLEANPGTLDADKLAGFHSAGINRLSLGMQSFNDDNLDFLTRIHNAAEAHAALIAACAARFDNLSCDLIYGLPGQTWQQWQFDLEAAVNYGMEHISCYTLTVEEGTVLHSRVAAGTVRMPSDAHQARLIENTVRFLADQGYERYEVSNFARPGRECRHNRHYWRIEPYLAFGPSAHGFDHRRRWWNYRYLAQYLRAVEAGRTPVEGQQILSARDKANELLGFGLRMAEGIDLSKLPGEQRIQLNKQLPGLLEKWVGKLLLTDNRLHLTDSGFLFADEIAVDVLLG